jgi:DNA polymerase I
MYRRRHGHPPDYKGCQCLHTNGIHMLLCLVQGQWPPAPKAVTFVEILQSQMRGEYAQWMAGQRCLAPGTVSHRCCEAGRLLDWLGERATREELATLTHLDVDGYLKYRAAAVGRRSLKDVTTKIRSFLRWLYTTERTSRDLSSNVIAPMLYAFESIPSALQSGDVEKILAATRQDCTLKGISILSRASRTWPPISGTKTSTRRWYTSWLASSKPVMSFRPKPAAMWRDVWREPLWSLTFYGLIMAQWDLLMAPRREDEWVWGWDSTSGIVSVWADLEGRAIVWRRIPKTGELVREETRFRPWLVLDGLDDLRHLGERLGPENCERASIAYRELAGAGSLRYLVSAQDGRALIAAILDGASRRLGRRIAHLRELGKEAVLALAPEEQYLVASGRTYFRGLAFDDLHRMQFDLETTGLDPERGRIFMIAVRHPWGATETLEADYAGDFGEAALIRQLVTKVKAADPDVIENHNLHGFDLPFLAKRAQILGVPLVLGRIGPSGLQVRVARRGHMEDPKGRRIRYVAPGRELIDTLDAVLRYDFATRELPNHSLKTVAQHLGIAGPDREQIRGDQVYAVYRRDPERVRRYATADVNEVAGVARMLGGAAFALAQIAPRRYERLADAGAATGVIDPLLVRAYLRAGVALPAHQVGDGTPHSGAALHLFAAGVAHRVVKADVASLYPSLMRAYRIGPSRDHLGALLALVDRLVELRLASKANGRQSAPESVERYGHEAMSAAMKLVVNSAYGYLAAGGLTRFADVHAANEVTRRGRETLELMCRELAARGVTLLEADTDGVYFAVPEGWTEPDERRVVTEVAAMLPPRVRLEFEGRYAAMLSHEPKNYALLRYDGSLILHGVAFRSSRAEPFGEAFLRKGLAHLLVGDVGGVRDVYLAALERLRRRELPTRDVSSRVRLTKTPAEYFAARDSRRELPYEAMLACGRTAWSVGDRVRVYRKRNRGFGLLEESENDPVGTSGVDVRDYDIDHYARQLRQTFASRLACAFTPADYESVFADPDQMSLFMPAIGTIRTVLEKKSQAMASTS